MYATFLELMHVLTESNHYINLNIPPPQKKTTALAPKTNLLPQHIESEHCCNINITYIYVILYRL